MFHKTVKLGYDFIQLCYECGGAWKRDSYEPYYLLSILGDPATECRPAHHHYEGECPSETCDLLLDCNCFLCWS
jgi:hypothetical protein